MPAKNFLPNFCSLRMLLAVFFLTELLAVLLTLAADSSNLGFLAEFALRSLFALWIALISIILLCGLANFLQRLPNGIAGLLAFAIILLVSLLFSWLVIELLPAWGILMPFLTAEEKFSFYSRTLGISSLVALALLRYLYVLFQWQSQMQAQAMAKLDALQARMRPHFLFNTLNSIASLTRLNPLLAESLIENLAELIRASMVIDQALLIPLERELHLVNLYLAIEQERLESRLKVSWRIDELPKDALIPPLTLQPLVENAIYYGIEPNPDGGEIVINGVMRLTHLFISISNPCMHTPQPLRTGNQMALKNIADRLNGCFEGSGLLRSEMQNGRYQVILEIPYRK